MTRIIHLSDPHFGTERPQVVDALQRLVRELSPDCLVLSGDITQRARPVQFRAARAFLDRLAVPHLLTIPGNHDISLFNPFKRLFAPYRDYRRWIGAELEPVIDLPDVLIIGVNTTRRYRHIQGEVSDRQVQSVARRLRAAGPAQTRIVVTHQPAWVIRPQDQHDRLRGHEDALKEWAKSGADLVLGGHIHLPYIAAIHECLAGMARPLWVVQAGTAVSSRVRAEADNSVNLIELDRSATDDAISGDVHRTHCTRCTISRWDYQPGPEIFSRISDFTINLERQADAGGEHGEPVHMPAGGSSGWHIPAA